MNRITTDFQKSGKTVAPVIARKTALAIVTKSDSESCPFRGLIDDWLIATQSNKACSRKTLLEYRSILYKFWWWWDHNYAAEFGMHPKNITVKHVRAFVVYLREPVAFRWGEKVVRGCETLSPASIATYGRTVKVFFNWLEQEEYIDKTPFNRSVRFEPSQKQSRLIKIVEKDDLNLIVQAMTQPDYLNTYHGARNLAIVTMLLDSGMRRGELLNMKLRDANLEKNSCLINGKTGERWVFFNGIAAEALTRYLKLWRYPQEELRTHSPLPVKLSTSPLWLTNDYTALSYESISKITRQIERISGVKMHLHSLRHTYATHMISRVDIYTVQQLLGHASVKTTERYLHGNSASMEAAYRPNSPLDALLDSRSGIARRRGRPRKQQKK